MAHQAHLAEEDTNFEDMTLTDDGAYAVEEANIDSFGDPLNLLIAFENAGVMVMKNEPRSLNIFKRSKI